MYTSVFLSFAAFLPFARQIKIVLCKRSMWLRYPCLAMVDGMSFDQAFIDSDDKLIDDID